MIAIALGLISAFATRSIMTRDSLEILVPVKDLPAKHHLKEPREFEVKFIPKNRITKGQPVLRFDQIQGRTLGAQPLKAGEPVYFEDLASAAHASSPPRTAPPLPFSLPPGKVVLSLAHHPQMPPVQPGDRIQIQEPPTDLEPRILASQVEVLYLLPRRPGDLPEQTPPQALLLSVKPAEAKAILDLLEAGKTPFVVILK